MSRLTIQQAEAEARWRWGNLFVRGFARSLLPEAEIASRGGGRYRPTRTRTPAATARMFMTVPLRSM